jgi:hypothetical protein
VPPSVPPLFTVTRLDDLMSPFTDRMPPFTVVVPV